MAQKIKTRDITIVEEGGSFNAFFKHFRTSEESYDFEGLSALRKVLSNEKAKILHNLKTKKPNSLYGLAKILKRDFKSVSEDIKLLSRFGFVDMVSEKTGNRNRLRPILTADTINISIKV
jgi:predicted transcriptional regulator